MNAIGASKKQINSTKPAFARFISKMFAVLNRLDMPHVLSCRANAINLAKEEQASFWGNTALPLGQQADIVRSSLSVIKKEGRIFWLWDERLPNGDSLQSALKLRLQTYLPKESL
jgi:hypothetical protein